MLWSTAVLLPVFGLISYLFVGQTPSLPSPASGGG
jgi:hypothetical protein